MRARYTQMGLNYTPENTSSWQSSVDGFWPFERTGCRSISDTINQV